MSEKSESIKSSDITSISFISSNYDNLELARAKASESVVNLDQFFPEIKSEIKIYSDKLSLLGDNSEHLENEDNFQTENVEPTVEEPKLLKSALFTTELNSTILEEDSEEPMEITFMPKSWTRKGLHSLQSMAQILDTRASDHYAAGMISLKSGKWLESISHFSRCIHLKPKEPSYYANRAEIFVQLVDFQSAILNYKRACILDPANEDFFNRLAFLYVFHSQILFDQSQFGRALESIGRAIEMQPTNSSYQIRAIACLAALNRHGECLALVNKQLDANNSRADLFVLRAKLHAHFRNFSLSYYDLVDALNLEPGHDEARVVMVSMAKQADSLKNWSVELALANRLQEAISKVSLAIELNPVVGDFHVKRAALYRRLGNFTAAIDDLIMAMDKVDHNEAHDTFRAAQRQLVLAFNDFAVDCFGKNAYEDAVVLLDKALASDKTEPQFYVNRADCFYRLRRFEFALGDYEQAGSVSAGFRRVAATRSALVHFTIGHEKFARGEHRDAEHAFTDAIASNPLRASFWNVRARCRYLLDEFVGARKDLISGILLAGFDKTMESIFSRLFPNKSMAHVLDSKLAVTAKKELDRIIQEREECVGRNREDDTHGETVARQTRIESSVLEEKLLADCIVQYNKLENRIKTCTSDKKFIKKSAATVTALPDLNVPKNIEYSVLGIVGTSDGKKFYMDNEGTIVKAVEQKGWRKFKSGIEL